MLFESRLSGQKWNWSIQCPQYSSQNVKNDQKWPDLPYKYPPADRPGNDENFKNHCKVSPDVQHNIISQLDGVLWP